MMIGVAAVAASLRSAWQTTRPSMPGSMRSSTMRSGLVARTRVVTALPEASQSTSCPARWR